jgi:hypothetical protein
MLPKCTLYPTAMQHAVLIAKAIGSHGRMNSCMWKVSSKRTQTTNTRSRCRWTMSHQKEAKAEEESDPVPRNEFGGVYVDEEELRAAFDFFDVQKKGTLVSKRAAVCGLRAAGCGLRAGICGGGGALQRRRGRGCSGIPAHGSRASVEWVRVSDLERARPSRSLYVPFSVQVAKILCRCTRRQPT